MNNTDPLADLKPLIEPPAIGWWPPAPGWWLLGVLVLLLLIALAAWLWRRRRYRQRTRYRSEALALLAALPQDTDAAQQLLDIASLLRRAAVCAFGQERAATQSWRDIAALTGTDKGLDETCISLLGEQQYRRETPSADDMHHLRTQAMQWLASLPPLER